MRTLLAQQILWMPKTSRAICSVIGRCISSAQIKKKINEARGSARRTMKMEMQKGAQTSVLGGTVDAELERMTRTKARETKGGATIALLRGTNNTSMIGRGATLIPARELETMILKQPRILRKQGQGFKCLVQRGLQVSRKWRRAPL